MDNKLQNQSVMKSSAKLYLNHERSDFYFTLQNEKVPANKCILAAGSPVFHEYFYGRTKEDVDSMEVEESTPAGFREFLQFFYLSEVTLTNEHIDEVSRLATRYGMFDCINSCSEFLVNQVTMDNILWTYKWAIAWKNEPLKQFCEKYIGATIQDIFQSDAFKRCDRDVLQGILEIDKLACKEADVLDACLSWARYACRITGLDERKDINLKTQLGDCFYLIRFGALKIEELAAYSVSHGELFTFDDHKNILRGLVFRTTPRCDFLDLSVWKKSRTMTCKRGYNFSAHFPVNFPSFELRFSVNVPALLGELKLVTKVRCQPCRQENKNFEVKLVEISGGSNDSASPEEKVLFTCSADIKTSPDRVPFTRAYVIHTYKRYAIRLVQNDYVPSETCTCYITSTPWNADYNLYGQLEVKLDEERPGLIESLGFQLM